MLCTNNESIYTRFSFGLFLGGSKSTSSTFQQNRLAARSKSVLGKNVFALPSHLTGVEEGAFSHHQTAFYYD